MIERVHDIGRRVESPAVSIHLKDHRRGATAFGCLLGASQKHQERGGNFATQRDYDYVTLVNDLTGTRGCWRDEKCRGENRDRR